MRLGHEIGSAGRALVPWMAVLALVLPAAESIAQDAPAPVAAPAAADADGPAAGTAGPAALDRADQGTAGPAEAAAPAGAARGPDGTALASVLAEEVHARCWPTENSPHYEDTFRKGAALRIGELERGHRRVLLPIGPVGYVHKKFTTAPAEGKVATSGARVAFRYRPRSGEAPVTLLDEGTEFLVVGEHEDWWRVRYPGRECWVPAEAVQRFDEPPATLVQAFAEFERVQRGEVEAWIASVAAAEEAERLAREHADKTAALREQFAAELQKPRPEQALEAIAGATEALLAEMPQDSPARPALADLQRRVAVQQWVLQATAAEQETRLEPPKDLHDVEPAVVPDPLERFQAIGFLRWEKSLLGPGNYVIERGGQRLYLVTCDSGRYELSVFVDREVGVIGSRRRPAPDTLRVLDVEKIEVLSSQ